MLEATQKRDVQATLTGPSAQDRQHRRLLVAIVLLLSAVILILAKDSDFWFGGEQTSAAEEVQPAPVVSTPVQTPAVPAQAANPVPAKHSVQPPAKAASKRALLPPLEMKVAAASAHTAAQVRTSRVTNAGEAVQMASVKAPVVDSAYPLLTGQTSVQGSVLMQALIAADGVVEDLRVLSGPTILVSAARDAVRQWKFKPYLQNGRPVETQARVTVNFTIKVSNNTARYQPTSITSDGAL
jgi:TonB family protein